MSYKPVAVDAMGGDHSPSEVVKGAYRAMTELDIPVVLVGRAEELQDISEAQSMEIIPAEQVIPMGADPSQSVRKMRDSSLVRAAEAVRSGRASAMVSAGNTGAAMGSALLKIGRIAGVARPAIAAPIPTLSDLPTIMLDAGANSECRPEWLVQFARMGSIYARDRFGIAKPRVGLLSIGEEDSKGSDFVKDVFRLLSNEQWAQDVHAEWIGNVEGHDVVTDDVDVVVTDGFTGNVTLKALEGALDVIVKHLRRSLCSIDLQLDIHADGSTGHTNGGSGSTETDSSSSNSNSNKETLKRIMDAMIRDLHGDNVGGALLLGVKGVCVISHGASNAGAVMNAVSLAHEMARANMVSHIAATVASKSVNNRE